MGVSSKVCCKKILLLLETCALSTHASVLQTIQYSYSTVTVILVAFSFLVLSQFHEISSTTNNLIVNSVIWLTLCSLTILYLHKFHNKPLLPSNILHDHYLQFLLQTA